MEPKLAIVIPAYKGTYLSETLKSLADQTNKHFNVYIGDDASPDPINEIIAAYSSRLNLVYKRYENNLGHESLAKHWNRCLQMVKSEEWVCFLPDDDMLSSGVVDAAYNFLNSELFSPDVKALKLSIVRLVNDKFDFTFSKKVRPYIESGYSFYDRLVRGEDDCTLGDVIYNKRRLLEVGLFEEYPKGWHSDHSALLKVVARKSMVHLKDANLIFRMSGVNISSLVSDGSEKMRARYLFVKWLKRSKNLFDTTPSKIFFRFLYWKGEYYFIYQWKFELKTLWYLFRLRNVSIGSYNPFPLVKAIFKKIIS
ncbi:MAG TPA: glycosyltransferase family 2 protein [Bacteroidia bacterium]|nr:glycosyltransferase family 2 protein [Bacteroidia bacterium]